MSISNTAWHPSRVEDRIYDLMNEEKYIAGIDFYTEGLFIAVHEMIKDEFPDVEWETFISATLRPGISLQSFAWVENGHVHLIGWDFVEGEK